MYVPFNSHFDYGISVDGRMESPQAQAIPGEDVLDVSVHNVIEYPCILCRKPTTFRYDSVPICEQCAGLRRL